MREETGRTKEARVEVKSSEQTGGSVGLLLDATREAERVLEQEARTHPSYADVRHRLGLLRLLVGDPVAAEREFEEALGINPGYRAAYYGLRLARRVQGLPVESLNQPDAQGPVEQDEVAWRAVDEAYQCLAEGKDAAAALKTIGQPFEEQLFHHYAGFFAVRAGDLHGAQHHFEAAASACPITRSAFERLGILPWDESQRDALSGRLSCVLWSPLAEDLYTYLGRIYARNGLRDEATDCFERAFLVLPREAQHAMHLAEIATAFAEESEAIRQLTGAIQIDPTSVPARIALGFEYASQGFLDEARTQFQVAAKLAPAYADVRYNLGLLYVGDAQTEEALAEFRKALSLNPSYLPARHSMAHLLCRMGKYEDGLREYARILKQGFRSGDMLVQMGKAALALGRNEEALHHLERAIFLSPEFAPSYYYIGQAYQRKGLKNKARSAWQTYLEKANEWEPLGPAPQIDMSDEAA